MLVNTFCLIRGKGRGLVCVVQGFLEKSECGGMFLCEEREKRLRKVKNNEDAWEKLI